jgi:type I restriction enzyme S subunit
MQRAIKGVAVRGINIGDVRALQIPVPPLPEQRQIVRRVDALFRLADAIEKRVAAATARADKLTQALLAKAFRGELVATEAELARADGRDYEPASALLERIRGERTKDADAAKSALSQRKRVSHNWEVR